MAFLYEFSVFQRIASPKEFASRVLAHPVPPRGVVGTAIFNSCAAHVTAHAAHAHAHECTALLPTPANITFLVKGKSMYGAVLIYSGNRDEGQP